MEFTKEQLEKLNYEVENIQSMTEFDVFDKKERQKAFFIATMLGF